ncbi:MAG: YbjN domain-containing protein [Sneathiellaceae bacterium]
MLSIREYSDRLSRPVKRRSSRAAAGLALAAAILCPGLAAAPARAQQDLTAAPAAQAATPRGDSLHRLVGPDLIARLVQQIGHELEQAGMADGRPNLVVLAGGLRYGIDFYQCVAGDRPDAPVCASMRFTTAFDLPGGMAPALANAWNRDRRFGRLWLDPEGDPNLEMDVSLAGGTTTAHLMDVLDWWTLVLGDFLQHLQALQAKAKPTAGSANQRPPRHTREEPAWH